MDKMNNQYVELGFDKDSKAIISTFSKFVPFNELLPISEYGFELVKQHKCEKYLVDLKQLPVHDAQTKDYISNTWFPQVKELGVRFVAIVLPDSIVGKMSSKKAHKSAETINGITVENFENAQDAMDWINSVN